MFQAAGQVTVVLGEVKFAESKFGNDPNAFDICIHCTHADDPNQADWWRGEVSQNYGRGNFATMKQAEIAMQTLHKAGFEGNDLTTLEKQLTGKKVPAMIKENPAKDGSGKVFYNISYIGGGGGGNAPGADEVINAGDMQARLQRMFGGGGGAAPAQAPAQPAPQAAPPAQAKNPFAGASGGGKNPFAGQTQQPSQPEAQDEPGTNGPF